MKVMFIDNKNAFHLCILPKIGEVVTVVGESDIYPDNWHIEEYPVAKDGTKQSIAKHRFIALSDICETELAKQRELQTA